jgi:hypothetical protein
MRITSLAAATTLAVAITLAGAGPAMAAPNDRPAVCSSMGGVLTGNGANEVCTVTDVVVAADVPAGAPTVVYSADRPIGESVTVDVSQPVRQADPTVTSEELDAGEASVVRTERAGTPAVTREERDAGAAVSTDALAQGTPSVAVHTELGTSTAVQTPTSTDCRRVNDARAARAVERCQRAELTTTTTPTTIVTTTTTPQQTVTTTTQPRETLITTTTPYTEVFTSTQPRELCTTLTYRTVIATLTTQQTERTATTTQTTTRTTTTTVTLYRFQPGTSDPSVSGTPVVTASTVAGTPVITEAIVAGTPILTDGSRPGLDEADTTCAPIAPVVTVWDGETRHGVVQEVEAAESIVTVTHTDIAPLVTVEEAPGAPIVTAEIRALPETCMDTPAKSDQRRNAC